MIDRDVGWLQSSRVRGELLSGMEKLQIISRRTQARSTGDVIVRVVSDM